MSDHQSTNNKLISSDSSGSDHISLSKRQTNSRRARLSSSNLQSNNQFPIISLSKLKNYMPQSQQIKLDSSCSVSSSSFVNTAPGAHSLQLPPVAYNQNSLHITNPSLCTNNHNKRQDQSGTRVKALSLSSTLGLGNSEGKTPTYSNSSGYHQNFVNQVVARVTQQGLSTNLQSNEQIGTQTTDCIKSKRADQTKHAELDQKLYLSRDDQSGRKLDASVNQNQGEKDYKGSSYSGNNMTPSSLLLLQNHNYIEQQQQQRQQLNNCCSGDNQNSREQGDNSSVGQPRAPSTRTSTKDCSGGANTSTSAETSDDQRQTHCHNSDLSSSSSFMLPNVSQFKVLDNVGNSIINSNSRPSSSANTVDTSDYLAIHDLNRVQSQVLEAEATEGSSSNNLHQNYQQGVPNSGEPKSNSRDTQFVNYSAQARVGNNSYQPNFTLQTPDQQLKLESVVNERNIFENKYPFGADPNNSQVGNSNVNSMITTRDLAHQQAMTSINQYYSHYNLMPTPSSKSSSPTSTSSTPSPKTSAMQPNTSQHSNQFAPTAINNPASRIHLDHLNHNYMSSNVGASISHPQHQMNQHYTYGQQVTGVSNQPHLSMQSHEQAYGHHQQHHHQPQHQNSHHQQQQQQQQQLHQQQQQQLQQQTVQNQQSIYHQLTNNASNVGVNNMYSSVSAGNHYHPAQNNSSGHQSNPISGSQTHLNTAAAACAAAAVVSQTLKTVANQHSQQHHYGSSMNGFSTTTEGLMNMTTHNQQFHSMSTLNHHHHLNNQSSINQQQQQQQQNLSAHHPNTIVARKYQCKMCPQVFMSKAEWKYHNQNHMREAKPYKCLQCHKAFANSSYLSQHMRIHQGLKPYTCDICSRKFTQLSHLQQHKRTHTGDKPYKCTYMNCTKQFSQLSNLQSHSRCHQLDKPYKCNSCYKCFHDEQSLLEHIPRHLESKHLKKNLCIFCGSSYQQERGLVKHFQQYHTDKTPTLVAAAIAAGTTGNTSLIASLVSSTTSNSFAKPSNGGGSCSSSSSSVSSSGSLNLHNNLNTVHSGSTGNYATNQY